MLAFCHFNYHYSTSCPNLSFAHHQNHLTSNNLFICNLSLNPTIALTLVQPFDFTIKYKFRGL